MKVILYIILMFFSTSGFAGEVVVNLFSKHIHANVNFNEENYGIGYRHNLHEVGFYRNSYYHRNERKTKDFVNKADGIGYSAYYKYEYFSKTIQNTKLYVDFGIAYYGKDGRSLLVPICHVISSFDLGDDVFVNFGYLPMFGRTTHYNTEGESGKTNITYGLLTFSTSYKF